MAFLSYKKTSREMYEPLEQLMGHMQEFRRCLKIMKEIEDDFSRNKRTAQEVDQSKAVATGQSNTYFKHLAEYAEKAKSELEQIHILAKQLEGLTLEDKKNWQKNFRDVRDYFAGS